MVRGQEACDLIPLRPYPLTRQVGGTALELTWLPFPTCKVSKTKRRGNPSPLEKAVSFKQPLEPQESHADN